MIYSCPFCRALFEMGADHLSEPCASCWKLGHRVDCFGNKSRVNVCLVCKKDYAGAYIGNGHCCAECAESFRKEDEDYRAWQFEHGGIGAARDGTDI